MTYLDYSATTKISKEVLDEVSKDLFTKATNKDIKDYQNKIKNILNTNHDVIFTSGSSESNNYAIKGISLNTKKKEIITTEVEHSSITETLSYLKSQGFIIKTIPIHDGLLSLSELKKAITKDTALITITAVNSETGLLNPVNEIGKIAKENNIPFHCDMTQSIGKINIPLDNIDLISLSSHKFYGPKGIGLLLKKPNIKLKPLIYGKRNYNLGLIKGLTKSLEEALSNIDEKYKKVEGLNNYLKDNLKNLPNIIINQSSNSIPHILNISVLNYKPETFLHYLEMSHIYISTQSACSTNDYSKSVYALTNDKELAKTSVRISLSYKTTKDELDKLIRCIKRSQNGN